MKARAKPRLPLSVAFASLLALSAPLAAQQSPPLVLGALKGPSGIALVRLFENPPELPGFSLKAVAAPSADVMAAKLISGEYQAGVLPINVAAKLRSSGIPLVMAAVIGNGMLSFLSADSPPSSLAALRGAEVHVAGQGATPDFLFRRLLTSAGLDPDRDLRLNYAMPYPAMAAAIAAGKISHAILPEPFATLAREANPALRAGLDLGALWTAATGQADYPMTALVISGKLAAERPEAARALLRAARDSIEWVRLHPAEAGLLVERHELGLTAQVAAKAIPRSAYVYVPAPESRRAVEALLSAFLETTPASIGGALPDDGFYAAF